MSLIDSTYFRNEISLTIGTYSDVQQFVDRFEKEVLIGLLGYTLYTEMMSAYAASIATVPTPLPQKWDRLINGYTYTYGGQTIHWNGLINSDKVSFIAYYVYCQYLKAKQFPQAQAGTVQPKNENSQVVDGIANHTASWNMFVNNYMECEVFISQYPDDYPVTNVKVYPFTNIFGI